MNSMNSFAGFPLQGMSALSQDFSSSAGMGVGGFNSVRAGDLFASGTVSGPEPGTLGSLLEITKNGNEPIRLDDGSELSYLGDGDTVIIRGGCASEGGPIIGFGECTGTVG